MTKLCIHIYCIYIFVYTFYLFQQHYTKDADGLCTRLIKPKLMEGTVAAQDEFSRSKAIL